MEYRLRKLGQYLRGWTAYFGISQYYRPVPELDEWIRRRIRMCYWKQWRWVRTKIRNLLALGVNPKSAILHGMSSKSYWHMSRTPVVHQALSNAWLRAQGLLSVKTKFQRRLTCTQVMPELKTCGARPRVTRQRDKEKLRRAGQLVEPPTADPHGGWCGGRRLEAVTYPIRPHSCRAGDRLFLVRHDLLLPRRDVAGQYSSTGGRAMAAAARSARRGEYTA